MTLTGYVIQQAMSSNRRTSGKKSYIANYSKLSTQLDERTVAPCLVTHSIQQ